jgi:hypothetical protein
MPVDVMTAATALWKGFVTLGGLAFIKQISDWIRKRPKLTGEIETLAFAEGSFDPFGVCTFVLMSVYLVNARTDPTTVRGWKLKVLKGKQKWEGKQILIPPDLRWDRLNVNFQTATRIYDYAAMNLLEYRKGVRGWIMFLVEGHVMAEIRNDAVLELTAIDALEGMHRLERTSGDEREVPKMPYFTGLGVR